MGLRKAPIMVFFQYETGDQENGCIFFERTQAGSVDKMFTAAHTAVSKADISGQHARASKN